MPQSGRRPASWAVSIDVTDLVRDGMTSQAKKAPPFRPGRFSLELMAAFDPLRKLTTAMGASVIEGAEPNSSPRRGEGY